MKIRYYDIFDIIPEVAVSILEDSNDLDYQYENFSVEETCNEVLEMIHKPRKKQTKSSPIKLRILIAALIIMASSVYAIAKSNIGAVLIDNTNRELIGKGTKGEAYINNRDSVREIKDEDESLVWNTTALISIHSDDIVLPNTITEISTKFVDGEYITPEIMFQNRDLVIFTKEDGKGWVLNSGDKLVFQATEYKAEANAGTGQSIGYFYIYNGEIKEGNLTDSRKLNQSYELTADKKGEYYICLMGASSDPIALKEGKILLR